MSPNSIHLSAVLRRLESARLHPLAWNEGAHDLEGITTLGQQGGRHMRSRMITFRDRRTLITIDHGTSDPAHWIVRQWTISWGWKKRIVSEWYTDKQQALRRAELLAKGALDRKG